MDALLLLVPLARAYCHDGRGDFHMNARRRAQAAQAERRRAVRLHRHPDPLEAAVRRRAARRAVLDQPALGPGDRGGALLRRGPPGPVVRHRPARQHRQGRSDAGRRLTPTGALDSDGAPQGLHHPAAPRLRRRARGRADRALRQGEDRARAGDRAGPQQPRGAGDPGRVRAALRAAGCCCRGWCRSAIPSWTSGSAACWSRSGEAPVPPAIEPANCG